MNKFDNMLQEAIEGLPQSMDPYAPSARTDKPDETNEGEIEAEPSPITDDESNEPDDKLDVGSKPEDSALGSDVGGLDAESLESEPEKPAWEPFNLKNRKELAFRREDGFKLRMYRLESVKNVWLAQLWIDDKIIDKGQIVVPPDVDPIGFIKSVADHMLDYRSRRYGPQVIKKDVGKPLKSIVGETDKPLLAEPAPATEQFELEDVELE